MEVTLTQRNPLTDNADGKRSETIMLLKLYSPIRLFNTELKYCESNGKRYGTVISVLQEFMETVDIMKLR